MGWILFIYSLQKYLLMICYVLGNDLRSVKSVVSKADPVPSPMAIPVQRKHEDSNDSERQKQFQQSLIDQNSKELQGLEKREKFYGESQEGGITCPSIEQYQRGLEEKIGHHLRALQEISLRANQISEQDVERNVQKYLLVISREYGGRFVNSYRGV